MLKYEEKAKKAYEKINVPFYDSKPTKQMRRFLKYKNKMVNEARKAPGCSTTGLPEINDESG
jgi:hypothetical protein